MRRVLRSKQRRMLLGVRGHIGRLHTQKAACGVGYLAYQTAIPPVSQQVNMEEGKSDFGAYVRMVAGFAR